MKLLHGAALDYRLARLCRNAVNRAVFVSAYVKNTAFLKYSSQVDSTANVDKVLVTRWNLADLVSGASDLEVYESARAQGWRVYLQSNLHAKVYVTDNTVMLGSSNLTASGFQLTGGRSNLETCIEDEVNQELETWLQRLLHSSVELDDSLFLQIQEQVESCPKPPRPPSERGFTKELSDALRGKLFTETLFTNDFIWTSEASMLLASNPEAQHQEAIDHDRELLKVEQGVASEELKAAFLMSAAWAWLSANAGEPVYFGSLTERLHDTLQDDPSVYRKTVKQLLKNLLAWSQALCPERIKIDVPNMSQRIQVL